MALAVACSPDRTITDHPVTTPGENGVADAPTVPPTDVGLPVAAPGEFELPRTVPMAGILTAVERGCWRLEGAWDGALVVLPPGSGLGGSGAPLLTSGGERVAAGDAVEAAGAPIGTDMLPGGEGGRWAAYIEVCDPDSQTLVVAQSLSAVEPAIASLDGDALLDLIATTTFDTNWPCGYGFAVSDDGQVVGLFVEPTTPQPPAPGVVTLPDARFEVTVVVGRHLFANHCDDVLEWFEPEAERVVTWPVTAGRFDYQPGVHNGACTDTRPVTTELTIASVATPGGALELPSIELVNDAFGCFAG